MNTQAEQLSDVNRKQREKIILFLKNRTENLVKKPSPLTSHQINLTHVGGYANQRGQTRQLSMLKQYDGNQGSQMQYRDLIGRDKSFEYASNIFQHIREESDIDKQSEPLRMETLSNDLSRNIQLHQIPEFNQNSNLLSKIDELLMGRKREKQKGGISSIYDEYLEKNSGRSLGGSAVGSGVMENKSVKVGDGKGQKNGGGEILAFMNSMEMQKDKIKAKTEDKSYSSEKKQKLPKKQLEQQKKNKNLPPKFPLTSPNTIQRQKRRLQQTMKELKKEQQCFQYHERSSIMLELSDDSENEEKVEVNGNGEGEGEIKKQWGDKDKDIGKESVQQVENKIKKKEKMQKLRKERESLVNQLDGIQKQLTILEEEEQDEEDQ